MDQRKIGNLIASIRKEMNMTQRNLADKLGVTDRAISKWENGRGMPDLSLIQPLCEILCISVNELLNGERIDKPEIIQVADKNVIAVLRECETEIKKRKIVTKICTVLLALVVLISGILNIRLASMIFASLTGEGYSISCAVGTKKIERASEYITDGNYEKAVKYIGFLGKDRSVAEKEWCESMKALRKEIDIERIEVSKLIVDDYFESGNVMLIVNDYKGVKYVFDLQVTIQDGGVAFGGIYIDNLNQDPRRAEVALFIEEALSTWNSG